MWLCTGISLLLFRLRTGSKRQKTWQVFLSAKKKKIFAWGVRDLMSDVISGGLLGHLGPRRQPLGGSFYWKLGYNQSLLIVWMTC